MRRSLVWSGRLLTVLVLACGERETDPEPQSSAPDASSVPDVDAGSGDAGEDDSDGGAPTASLPTCAANCECRSDRFVIPRGEPVDFLLVLDNSGSLMEEQQAIARHFDDLIESAWLQGVDFHLGVTTTGLFPNQGGWSDCPGGVNGGEAGRLFPVDGSRPRILTPATPDLRATFAANVNVGLCQWWEEGLEAMRLALSPPLVDSADDPRTPEPLDGNAGFLREDATLFVLFVADEEDAGSVPVEDYAAHLLSLKPGHPERVKVGAIVASPSCMTAPSVGVRYEALIDMLDGELGDICDPDWGAMLSAFGASAFHPATSLRLSASPLGSRLTVSVDGTRSEAWRFDATVGRHGAVVFDEGRAPPAGSEVEVHYRVACAPK